MGATLFQTKLALYTTYVVAGRVEKGSMPDALLWDTVGPVPLLPSRAAKRNSIW